MARRSVGAAPSASEVEGMREESFSTRAMEMGTAELHAEIRSLQERLTTLSDSEDLWLRILRGENERRNVEETSHERPHRAHEGKTIKNERPTKMAMFDPRDTGLGDAKEPEAVEPGEYKISILSVYSGVTREEKGALEYWMPNIEILGHPEAKDLTEFLYVLNKEKMSTKQYKDAVWKLQTFMDGFKLSYDGPFCPEEEWPGAEGWAMLRKVYDDRYGWQNKIDKMIPPR